jgi:hypothetical protein
VQAHHLDIAFIGLQPHISLLTKAESGDDIHVQVPNAVVPPETLNDYQLDTAGISGGPV